ncbi:hypothetical protein MAPG_11941 [Magnaporthiopsis poae ATCC 64411]|uniref:Uncharacterized protein n=1 Tax=Magnaporthiopsis poae (strain ATCC 64411 / 73-15) TaxID=644358 RepID=A0A0C4EGI9_MAGP6|nr:hypothetical protein MAPG_11941 [Magnaporthiopsis poae ATCC 64411]
MTAFPDDEVVQLLGPFNIDAWNKSLLANLGDLQPFITHKPVKPRKPEGREARKIWKRCRRTARELVSQSLTSVSHLLQVGSDAAAFNRRAGRGALPSSPAKDRRARRNPRKIYESALHAMRVLADSTRVTTSLVRQLCTVQRSNFQSLAAYQNRIQDLRRQLSLLGCDPGDRFMVFLAIGGLDSSSGAVQDRLLREVFTGRGAGFSPPPAAQAQIDSPTVVGNKKQKNTLAMGTVAENGTAWRKLMEQMSTRAIKERCTPVPQPGPGEQSAKDSKNDLGGPVTP